MKKRHFGFVATSILPFLAGACAGSRTLGWNETVPYGTLTDSRDGHSYRTVRIGNRTWMAQNLDHETDPSWCYDDQVQNCARYGRLYPWSSAAKACPEGWHLADARDWSELVRAVDSGAALERLSSSTGWDGSGKPSPLNPARWFRPISPETNSERDGSATDPFGFRILPAGIRARTDGAGEQAFAVDRVPGGEGRKNGGYAFHGIHSYFWSASPYAADWTLPGDSRSGFSVVSSGDLFGSFGFSVRCVADPP